MSVFDFSTKGKGHGKAQGGFGNDNDMQEGIITNNAPAMTASQKAEALSLAKDFGTQKEYNLIKSLNINIPNPITGAADLVNNVLKFVNRAIGA